VYGEGPVSEAPAPPFITFNERVLRPLTSRDIRFTTKGKNLYAIVCGWPESETLTIKSLAVHSPLAAGKVADVHLLGHKWRLQWSQDENGLTIHLPSEKPGDYAYAFKIAGLAS